LYVAHEWFDEQRERGYPDMKRGDIFLSMYHGGMISPLIAFLQGKGKSHPEWSHVGIYIGNGKIAEATYPHGGIRSFERYMNPSYTVELYSPANLTEKQRALIASEAARIAPHPYDTMKFVRHLIDNVFERWTWSEEKQCGFRPLSALFRLDLDGDKRNICSELVERAYAHAGIQITSGETGSARPNDVWWWLRQSRGERPYFRHNRGEVILHEG
jgi:cell wall-associated NlpC family hydrolase